MLQRLPCVRESAREWREGREREQRTDVFGQRAERCWVKLAVQGLQREPAPHDEPAPQDEPDLQGVSFTRGSVAGYVTDSPEGGRRAVWQPSLAAFIAVQSSERQSCRVQHSFRSQAMLAGSLAVLQGRVAGKPAREVGGLLCRQQEGDAAPANAAGMGGGAAAVPAAAAPDTPGSRNMRADVHEAGQEGLRDTLHIADWEANRENDKCDGRFTEEQMTLVSDDDGGGGGDGGSYKGGEEEGMEEDREGEEKEGEKDWEVEYSEGGEGEGEEKEDESEDEEEKMEEEEGEEGEDEVQLEDDEASNSEDGNSDDGDDDDNNEHHEQHGDQGNMAPSCDPGIQRACLVAQQQQPAVPLDPSPAERCDEEAKRQKMAAGHSEGGGGATASPDASVSPPRPPPAPGGAVKHGSMDCEAGGRLRKWVAAMSRGFKAPRFVSDVEAERQAGAVQAEQGANKDVEAGDSCAAVRCVRRNSSSADNATKREGGGGALHLHAETADGRLVSMMPPPSGRVAVSTAGAYLIPTATKLSCLPPRPSSPPPRGPQGPAPLHALRRSSVPMRRLSCGDPGLGLGLGLREGEGEEEGGMSGSVQGDGHWREKPEVTTSAEQHGVAGERQGEVLVIAGRSDRGEQPVGWRAAGGSESVGGEPQAMPVAAERAVEETEMPSWNLLREAGDDVGRGGEAGACEIGGGRSSQVRSTAEGAAEEDVVTIVVRSIHGDDDDSDEDDRCEGAVKMRGRRRVVVDSQEGVSADIETGGACPVHETQRLSQLVSQADPTAGSKGPVFKRLRREAACGPPSTSHARRVKGRRAAAAAAAAAVTPQFQCAPTPRAGPPASLQRGSGARRQRRVDARALRFVEDEAE